MKFEDIPGRGITVPLHPIRDGENYRPCDILSIRHRAPNTNVYDLLTKDGLYPFQPDYEQDARILDNEVLCGVPFLARLIGHRGAFSLEVKVFAGRTTDYGALEVGIDEKQVESSGMKHFSLPVDNMCHQLSDEFVYVRDDNTCWFFTVAGYAAEREYTRTDIQSSDQEDESDIPSVPIPHLSRLNSFQLIGATFSFVATATEVEAGREIYLMSRLHEWFKPEKRDRDRRKRPIDPAIQLTTGFLKFSDWTRTGEVSSLIQGQLARLAKEQGGYMNTWDAFGKKEGELLLKHAREAGELTFSSYDPPSVRRNYLIVHLDEPAPESWNNIDAVEFLARNQNAPSFLSGPFSYEKFVEEVREKSRQGEEVPRFKVIGWSPGRQKLFLDAKLLPKEQGRLVMSLAGEKTQILRRDEARRRIYEGRSANPNLKLIVEEAGQPVLLRPPRKVQALTPFVKRKIFPDYPPTSSQEEAIRIALNTPDIALIQGPPGTGKTTVIAAILERLNEDTDKRKIIPGAVLVTGCQHDAVENIVSRVMLNSLPVPKFGQRSNDEKDDENYYQILLEEWGKGIAKKIREKYPNLNKTEAELSLDATCKQYLEHPSKHLAEQIVRCVAGDDSPVTKETRSHARLLLDKNKQGNRNERGQTETLRCVRELRTTREGFADDGPDQALALQDILQERRERNSYVMSVLGEAAQFPIGACPPDDLFRKLKEVKKILMQAFLPPPAFRREKHNVDVTALAKQVREDIDERRCQVNTGIEYAFARLLVTLEQNPREVQDFLSGYSFAYAATCQQSLGDAVKKQKLSVRTGMSDINVPYGSDWPEYDYVIVDEAARVSPRDLMIVMAQGKHVILVGDHRQLPHLIDEEVARKLEINGAQTPELELAWLKESMFEYLLYQRIPQLEEIDGVRRHVTLDKQYRMHPILADFVSKNFYERFNSSEKFVSGLPETARTNNLAYADGTPAVWLNVPRQMGDYTRTDSGSLVRECEASVIRKVYSEWSSSEEGKDLTYGIISFYKKQADFIREELGGIKDSPRLRIGSVDSFQGMEFDVVFLSLVRTARELKASHPKNSERDAARLYGFLSLDNRLNVAMSRQKRVLVLVGDLALTEAPFAEKYIPGLVNFRKLCEEQGKVWNCSNA